MRDTTRIKPIKSNQPLAQPKKPAKKKTSTSQAKSAPKKGGAQYPTFSDQRKKPQAKKPAQKRDESVLFYKSTPPKGSSSAKNRAYYKQPKKKSRRTGAMTSVAALMVMVGALLIFVCFGPNNQYAAQYITDIGDSFLAMEEQYQVEEQTDTTQEVPTSKDSMVPLSTSSCAFCSARSSREGTCWVVSVCSST